MALKIKRGSGAPTALLKDGEPYLDKDSGDLYMGDGEQNIRYQKAGYTEPDIKVASGTIPAIPADTREVVQVNLGELNNKTQALIGLYDNVAVDAEIKKLCFSNSISGKLKNSLKIIPSNRTAGFQPLIYGMHMESTGNMPFTAHAIIVSTDYLKTKRTGFASINEEFYGADVEFPRDQGLTYGDINIGVLAGWYTSTGEGVFMLNKKVQMESAWLTQDGDDTVLNIALKNVDTEANTAMDFKVAVYE